MKMTNEEWEDNVIAMVDTNHHRAVASAKPAPVQIAPEHDRPRLSERVLNVLGGVLWTAVMALTFVACLIYSAA